MSAFLAGRRLSFLLVLASGQQLAVSRLQPGGVTNSAEKQKKLFLTVAEAAKVLRVDQATIYRSIREDAFPAVRLRTRYVVPAAAIEQMIARVMESGGVLDIAEMTRQRRDEREFERQRSRSSTW